ncbi:MAG: chromosomal replication initiator protein DnaA, partial [Mycoplasmataceae bacterium]|nr:chromosomal replication initiator protein DnaA [Mycoplasmataceae bacterium]
ALYEANKQIIISSDKPPNEIPKLEDRLRTRFAQGLATDIQPPDFETRIAILKKKADDDNIQIEGKVFEYIAEHIQSNIRELEGTLVRISAYSKLNNVPIDLEYAKKCLETLITPTESIKITGDLIQQKVAEYYKIKVDDLKAKRRTQDIAYPRQIAMYLCREMTDLSLPKIGELFGRDHSTVIHAYEKITQDIKNDQNLQISINHIKDMMNPHK